MLARALASSIALPSRYNQAEAMVPNCVPCRDPVFCGRSGLAIRRRAFGVPIVSAVMGNPFGTGPIASLARPGGNITGLSGKLRTSRHALRRSMAARMPFMLPATRS